MAKNNGGRRRGDKPSSELGQPPPLSTSALAKRIGMSASFVRMEIRAGEIRAIRVGHGRRCVYRIPFDEAMRYVRQLGLL
jgi:excisionase family DNA binding protein